MNIGKRLKLYRIAANLTQKEICKLLNISQSSYSNAENNIGSIDLSTFLKLYEYYGITPNDFFEISVSENKEIIDRITKKYLGLNIGDRFMIDEIFNALEKRDYFLNK